MIIMSMGGAFRDSRRRGLGGEGVRRAIWGHPWVIHVDTRKGKSLMAGLSMGLLHGAGPLHQELDF